MRIAQQPFIENLGAEEDQTASAGSTVGLYRASLEFVLALILLLARTLTHHRNTYASLETAAQRASARLYHLCSRGEGIPNK